MALTTETHIDNTLKQKQQPHQLRSGANFQKSAATVSIKHTHTRLLTTVLNYAIDGSSAAGVADDDTLLFTQSIILRSRSHKIQGTTPNPYIYKGDSGIITSSVRNKWSRLQIMRHLKKDTSTTNRPHYLSNSLTSRNVYILPIEIQLKGRKKGGREEGKGRNGSAGEGGGGVWYFLLKSDSRFVRFNFSHECSGFDLLAIYCMSSGSN